MKWIVIMIGFTISGWSCTGDCMTCHPALLKTINTDLRHKSMLTCIKCHSADPAKMGDCGSDCFACHPIAKIEGARVAEHTVIRECRDCHMKLKTKVEFDVSPKGQSVMPTLRDFLKP
ncbi:MAG: hypothetical protein NTY39_05115 [Campylobacterales bacterium]|nr:hypothetical protein [Campylobacterales bacterium]